jgi:hypothetical protein
MSNNSKPEGTNNRYHFLVVTSVLAAFVPWVVDRFWTLPVMVELAIALAWTLLAFLTMRVAKAGNRRGLWIWLFLPVAYWPAGVTLFTYGVWKVKGFAP